MAFVHVGELIAEFTRIDQGVINDSIGRDMVAVADMPEGLTRVLILERDGGVCHLCGTPWGAQIVTSHHANFTYHTPGCSCFPRCNHCGKALHREHYLGVGCLDCPSHSTKHRNHAGERQRF